jgi:hypothetical protein
MTEKNECKNDDLNHVFSLQNNDNEKTFKAKTFTMR